MWVYTLSMQYQVPQNITLEDKIVGSLTIIQFTIVVLGGGLSFFVGTSPTLPAPLNEMFGGVLALCTLVLALGKFNDQPMYRFLRHIISFVIAPKVRVWHKGGGEITLVKPNLQVAKEQTVHTVKKISKQDIARLAVVLDSRGSQGVMPQVHKVPQPAVPTSKPTNG